ncbi:MAG: hypothetical protein HYY76_13265 [Acidobacteria bacterium]|nr:hypothetical protein [Acidobacteriota bacterium]
MTITIAMLAVGAVLTAASPWIPLLEQWGPLLLLWTAGGAHLAWIVSRSDRSSRSNRSARST